MLYVSHKPSDGDASSYLRRQKTYAKGRNCAIILDAKQSKLALSHLKEYIKAQKEINKNKTNNSVQEELEQDAMDRSTNRNLIFNVQSRENFQNTFWNKGAITKISDGPIDLAYDIKIDDKTASLQDLKNYVASLKVGPEYLASMVEKDGIYSVGNDIITDNDLVAARPSGRMTHIHDHPPIALKKISFKYVSVSGNNKIIMDASTGDYAIPKNNGVDDVDHAQADNRVPSVMVDGKHVSIFGTQRGETIRFNRETRKYESN